MKRYWLREEISIADELLAAVPALREEFLAYHTDFINGDFVNGKIIDYTISNATALKSHTNAWKGEPMRYAYDKENIDVRMFDAEETKNRFPTASAIAKKWVEDCGICGYSILEKQSVILRHTGKENRDNEYLRIHVPLIVPEGDIFFECEGVEIDWRDIWGFNNQLIHSAHNSTDFRRLVFLIDIRRSAIGLPPEPKYDPDREKTIPKFVRGNLPKIYHTCQQHT
jgi:hypothetical protein